MDINLIGVPIYYGCDRSGVDNGPDKFRELGIINCLENNKNKVYDTGNLYVPTFNIEMKYNWHEKMKYFNPIVEVATNLAHSVYCSLNSQCFPLVIGGDHSLGMGSIAGASRHFNELAVIWVDAHADINDYETTPSGNVHGMPLGASMGYGHELITKLYYDGVKVKPENVYIIGARDIDEGEIRLVEKAKLNLYTMDTIRQKGLKDVLEEVINKVKASTVDGVHLSYDIDVFDSAIVPGTGTPVADGFTLEDGILVLDQIIGSGFVTSMDIVEFNPLLDDENNTTAKLCLNLVKHLGNLL